LSGPTPVPRAPGRDGAVVAVPPLADARALLGRNRQRLHRPDRAVLGRPWPDLQASARHQVLAASRAYLTEGGEPLPEGRGAALVVAGHQPELFHPGVWVKNFALQGLARGLGATAVNLVVDNDTVKHTGLRLPAPPGEEAPWPHLVTVPFDRWGAEAPYEERAVLDPELFGSFAERASGVLRPWGYRPLLPDLWADVLRARRPPLLGERFAQARRNLERAWGCHNFEVPLSAVCRTETFAWFACGLLADLPRFHALYNEVVREHRLRHHIRSKSHPVPDLAAEGYWLEAPFWGWRAGQARRGRLFARLGPDRIELRAGAEPWPTLPAPTRPEECVGAWLSLEALGFKARSRALTTTLYARLFLADLFIHGIGGGKYDELTDELMRRFYSCEAPGFIILSATRWLPLPAPPVGPDDRRQLARELRDLHYNPQRHLGPALAHDPGLAELAREKWDWIARRPADPVGRRERFRVLREVTERLRAPLVAREHQSREELRRLDRQLAASSVLHRRDFSFCLYPESSLRPFCTQFMGTP
jgi:hypothetical protein